MPFFYEDRGLSLTLFNAEALLALDFTMFLLLNVTENMLTVYRCVKVRGCVGPAGASGSFRCHPGPRTAPCLGITATE